MAAGRHAESAAGAAESRVANVASSRHDALASALTQKWNEEKAAAEANRSAFEASADTCAKGLRADLYRELAARPPGLEAIQEAVSYTQLTLHNT